MQIKTIAQRLNSQNARLVTVESCTGGMIAALCTDLPGSSSWYQGGWVTYSNEMKVRLGVSEAALSQYGAVSEVVAAEMAKAGLAASTATHAVAVTGIAGPGGGSDEKPVGTVCFAWADPSSVDTVTVRFSGGREEVRQQSAKFALQRLLSRLEANN